MRFVVGINLEVRMLGAFAIDCNGQMIHGSLGSKGRLLAAYLLAYPNRMHRREFLTDLFWENDESAGGRNALNTALWRFRKTLSATLASPQIRQLSVADEVMLEIKDASIVDIHKFQSLAKSLLDEKCQSPCSRDLLAELSDYQGLFLDGEEASWILEERERLHCLYVRVLVKLMRRFASARRYEDALECGRLVLREDPLRELVQRSVILLYLLNGQQAEAIGQFDRFHHLLRTECDVKPMPETVALNELIRSGAVFQKIPELTEEYFEISN